MKSLFPRLCLSLAAVTPALASAECPSFTRDDRAATITVENAAFDLSVTLGAPLDGGAARSRITMRLPDGAKASASSVLEPGEFVYVEAVPPLANPIITVCSDDGAGCSDEELPPTPSVEFRRYLLADGSDRFVVHHHIGDETVGVLVGSLTGALEPSCLSSSVSYTAWLAEFETSIGAVALDEALLSVSDATCPDGTSIVTTEPAFDTGASDASGSIEPSAPEGRTELAPDRPVEGPTCVLPYVFNPNVVLADSGVVQETSGPNPSLERLREVFQVLDVVVQRDDERPALRRAARLLARVGASVTDRNDFGRLTRVGRNIQKLRSGVLTARQRKGLIERNRLLLKRIRSI